MSFLPRHFIIAALVLASGLCHAEEAAPPDSAAGAPATPEVPAAPAAAADAPAPQPDYLARPWNFTVGPYVHHWSQNPEHRQAFIFALDRHVDERRLVGLSLFRNSFGQPSAYAYAGYHWHNFLGEPRLTAKLTAGIIYGYVGKYEDKVPLNYKGFSPGLIPSLGYKVTQQDALHVMLLGTAGFVLGFSHNF